MTLRHPVAFGMLTAGALVALGAALSPVPLVLRNTTPSIRLGFYRLSANPIQEGALVAFSAPESLRAYAPMASADLARDTIIKPILAGPGRRVCATAGRVEIDGVGTFDQAAADSRGNPLPQFDGCRQLGADEVFTVSTRVPNSLDSRYFGPIRISQIKGVYVPLWTPGFMQ